MQDPKASY